MVNISGKLYATLGGILDIFEKIMSKKKSE